MISTGTSSLKAAEAVIGAGAKVIGMLAIFTYSFNLASDNFKKANIELTTLSHYQKLIEMALELGKIKQEHVETLMQWREDPANWGK